MFELDSVKRYIPNLYKDVLEMDAIAQADDIILNIFGQEITEAWNNEYVLTSDVTGVKKFEKILNIIPNPITDSLDFRKERVINRLSTNPPFTMVYLRQKLNSILGENTWNAYVDYSTRTLYLESSAKNQAWYQEVLVTINTIKPANLVFINRPLVSHNFNISESISYQELHYNYILGSWELGKEPFADFLGGGEIKVPSTPSVQEPLVELLLNTTKDTIHDVLINDEVVITEFTEKTIEDNVLNIGYEVTTEMAQTLTKVAFRDSDENVLLASNVYIPMAEDVSMKHKIVLREEE